jgi:hypothetical protein
MNDLAIYIDAVPVGVGAAEASPADLAAWDAYLKGVGTSLLASQGRMVLAYRTLKSVREGFGLSFLATGEGALSPGGALTESENVRFMEAAGMSQVALGVIEDALNNKRKIGYDTQGNLGVEALPDDGMQIVLDSQGKPRLVDDAGNPVDVTGTVALAPLAIGAIAAVVTFVVVFAVEEICDTLKVKAEQKTIETLGQQQKELVDSGKATPDQARAMTTGLLQSATALEEAKASAKKAEGDTGLSGAVKAITTAGIVVAVIYLAAQVIPMFAGRKTAAVAA